ncbi:MAG TPA: CRISPR-associated protein Cas4 [Pirellulales bacterium]|nr:CRISPR-associated protein Cas4 [Pirellulales bacterium]
MFTEDELLPISALQHLLFCERQCALIHIEQIWAENRFTVEGQHFHRKAHAARPELRDGVRIARGLPLRSFRLGLVGKADIVEFGASGLITPVEYKRGRPKKDDSDRVQLCAQAICLEEMLHASIDRGALFYGRRRRRTEVLFDLPMRELTESVARRLHALIASRQTPLAWHEPKCDHCSLLALCMPGAVGRTKGIVAQIDRTFGEHLASVGPQSDTFSWDNLSETARKQS